MSNKGMIVKKTDEIISLLDNINKSSQQANSNWVSFDYGVETIAGRLYFNQATGVIIKRKFTYQDTHIVAEIIYFSEFNGGDIFKFYFVGSLDRSADLHYTDPYVMKKIETTIGMLSRN